MIIYSVSVIRPALEYACPVWWPLRQRPNLVLAEVSWVCTNDQINASESESESESDTNLNRHLTESLETVQKRAHSLCLTNLQCLKERRDSLCKK